MPDIVTVTKAENGLWKAEINGHLVDHFLTERDAWLKLKRAEEHYNAAYKNLHWNIVVPPKPKRSRFSSPVREYVLAHPGQELRRRDIQKAVGLSETATRAVLQRMERDGLVEKHGHHANIVWYVKGETQ